MPSIKNVQRKIRRVEGFEAIFLHLDGHDVNDSMEGVPQYPFANAADNYMTVEDWKRVRFRENYPGFKVAVLDGVGTSVDFGQTKLVTVRATYDH